MGRPGPTSFADADGTLKVTSGSAFSHGSLPTKNLRVQSSLETGGTMCDLGSFERQSDDP